MSPFLKCETTEHPAVCGLIVSDSSRDTVKVKPSPIRLFFFGGSIAAAATKRSCESRTDAECEGTWQRTISLWGGEVCIRETHRDALICLTIVGVAALSHRTYSCTSGSDALFELEVKAPRGFCRSRGRVW